MSAKRIKGVEALRTLAGRADHAAEPHRGYLRLACLEMERSRRGQERKSAMDRVRSIDDRFQEIDVEQSTLLRGLGLGVGDSKGDGANSAGRAAHPVAPPCRKGSLTVMY